MTFKIEKITLFSETAYKTVARYPYYKIFMRIWCGSIFKQDPIISTSIANELNHISSISSYIIYNHVYIQIHIYV